MSKFLVRCSDCKKDIKMIRVGGRWEAYNDTDDIGPHKCKVVRDAKKYLRSLGFSACRGCGNTVQWATDGVKRFPVGISGRRHKCSEKLLPPELRGWSGDNSYPWEHRFDIPEKEVLAIYRKNLAERIEKESSGRKDWWDDL